MGDVSTKFDFCSYSLNGKRCDWCNGRQEPGVSRTSCDGTVASMRLCFYCERLYLKAKEQAQEILDYAKVKAWRNSRRRNK